MYLYLVLVDYSFRILPLLETKRFIGHSTNSTVSSLVICHYHSFFFLKLWYVMPLTCFNRFTKILHLISTSFLINHSILPLTLLYSLFKHLNTLLMYVYCVKNILFPLHCTLGMFMVNKRKLCDESSKRKWV